MLPDQREPLVHKPEKGCCCRQPAAKVTIERIQAAGNKYVQQKDGRILEYATCGLRTGTPVYYANMYGSTCNALSPIFDAYAKKHGLFMFSVSMPGFGLSDCTPLGYKRSLLEWPADVDLVMQAEGVQNFIAMGASTGCVHTAAVAQAFPERILAVMMHSPTAPHRVEQEGGGIALKTKVTKWALGKPYLGDMTAKVFGLLDTQTRMALASPDVYAALKKWKREGGEGQKVAEYWIADGNRCTCHTSRGWTDNIHTIVDELPFPMSELERHAKDGRHFWITTAPDDLTNPPPMQKWWNDSVPGSTLLHFDEGYGHLHGLAPENMERIFGLLASIKGPGQA